jgi:hypothetical protein
MRAVAAAQDSRPAYLPDGAANGLEEHPKWELLDLAEGEFDVFITADQGIRYQQNLTGRQIGILELSTNKLRLIEAAASQIKEAVDSLGRTEFRRLEIPKIRLGL